MTVHSLDRKLTFVSPMLFRSVVEEVAIFGRTRASVILLIPFQHMLFLNIFSILFYVVFILTFLP